MGHRPNPLIPAPRDAEIRPTDRVWPRDVRVQGELPASDPLVGRYRQQLAGRGAGQIDVRLAKSDMAAEAYEIDCASESITVRASGPAGYRHALATLRQIASDGVCVSGHVRDAPALAVRGFHLNLESYRQIDAEAAIRLLETAARFKLNTVLVEYGPRFPYRSHPEIVAPDALSPTEIERLRAAAADCGLTLVPLQQSLAHLEYVLRHDAFADLRERAERDSLLCPTHERSAALITALADELLAAHPEARWFHIGGDEARKVGACERCRPRVASSSVGAVYGQFMGTLARRVLERGVRPIIWDDSVCAHPDALDHLPRETIIQYWDYIAVQDPTPVLIPRMAHALGGPRVAHDLRWSLLRRRGRVSDVQAAVMRRYSEASPLKMSLGRAYQDAFGRYLGPGFPKWIRALPYLEYYLDRGHDVITSPTGMGNGDTEDGVPNFERFEHNIRTHAARCRENGRALGMITTFWYNMPPELMMQPLVRTAMCAW